ncbi:uncharacterized protein si:ch73-109d9.1 isoform X1 [Puntigrus tetrazona]|uniref:uncharacterized protein si:ch73-109d9.1 isoform X1 n=1 Tax=Puntigrus tetrazona TaxID=1606681 RepID=UPI001C8A22F7|nr:uncharacterized protein si:ch73-109d9.1 isoform X1 [Puntigrus tetrazona]
MSEALFLTFQSQLSVVMETVLKSAMFEITRLVEDSFLEEVGHRKQEVEVLKRRLQLSESKLREREREWERGRKTRCPDCGRTGEPSSRDESQPVETVRGSDSLCLGLSLRDQPTNQPTLTEEVWSARQRLESTKQTTAHSHSKEKNDVHRQNAKEIVTPNSNAQIHQDFLQRILGNAPVHSESTSDFKPRASSLDKSDKNFTLDKDMESNHSRLSQSPSAQDAHEDLPSSSPNGRVKTETELDLLPVKEEEEMVPVWDSVSRDDGCNAEMADTSQGELRGPCDQEEIQVESFPGLNSLDMPDATSYFTPYSVSTLVHQGIRAQHSHLCTTELMLSSIPERSHAFVQPENGQSYPGSKSSVLYSPVDVCPGEKAISHAQYTKRFSQDKHGTPEQIHAERSHHCTQCGKKFARACDLKAHSLFHKGKKPLSCSAVRSDVRVQLRAQGSPEKPLRGATSRLSALRQGLRSHEQLQAASEHPHAREALQLHSMRDAIQSGHQPAGSSPTTQPRGEDLQLPSLWKELPESQTDEGSFTESPRKRREINITKLCLN